MKGRALESAHYIVAHCNIGVTEYLFNTSFSSWKYSWLLEIGTTFDMTFQRDFFEYFNDNVEIKFYFVDK